MKRFALCNVVMKLPVANCGAEQRNSTPVACEAGRACDKEDVRGRGEINSYIIFVEGG